MKVCMIYSGHLRTWDKCRPNHEANLLPTPMATIHYNETNANISPHSWEDWAHYRENRYGECEPGNTMNMWHCMYMAWELAPPGFDCYVRNRYDIQFSAPIHFDQYEMKPNRVYIPVGNDYREGVNDQFAFGSFDAMLAYHSVYLEHDEHFAAGKLFHSESYLKHTLDKHGIEIVRIPQTQEILRG